jgi:hypothetical protein
VAPREVDQDFGKVLKLRGTKSISNRMEMFHLRL